jgi:hypothetical protein
MNILILLFLILLNAIFAMAEIAVLKTRICQGGLQELLGIIHTQ